MRSRERSGSEGGFDQLGALCLICAECLALTDSLGASPEDVIARAKRILSENDAASG